MGPAHSPQLNGVAERFKRTLLDRVLPNLFKARLPVRFWTDAARHQPLSFLINLERDMSERIVEEEDCLVLWSEGFWMQSLENVDRSAAS